MTVRPLTTASGSHLRVVALLAEYRELTDAQLVRRYQSRALRATDPWPMIAESSLRTRREELAGWSEVVEISREGRSAFGRSMGLWCLNPVPHPFTLSDGQPVIASPGFTLVLEQLRATTDDLLILEAMHQFACRVGADI